MKENGLSYEEVIENIEKIKRKLIELAKDHFRKFNLSPENFSLTIGIVIDYKEAEEFRTALETALSTSITLPIGSIGVTIGTHTEPHPIGLGPIQKYDCQGWMDHCFT